MADVKPVSFRISEEDQEKFKQFASESGFNQAEAFKSLINTWEMAQAKTQIGDRAKEIETFQDTINTLMGMFINSLAINQTSEERIREQLSLEIKTKDLAIQDLQIERNKLKEKFKNIEETNEELVSLNKTLSDEIKKVQKEINIKIETEKNQQEQISTLNSIVTEYKEYKEINIKLDSQNKKLISEISIKDNMIKQLQGEIKNNADIISFYKEQLESNKEEIKNFNKFIEDKEKSYKKEIEEGKTLYKNTLDIKEKEYKEKLRKFEVEFKDKLDFEMEKKQLEVDKLKNKLDNLKKSK